MLLILEGRELCLHFGKALVQLEVWSTARERNSWSVRGYHVLSWWWQGEPWAAQVEVSFDGTQTLVIGIVLHVGVLVIVHRDHIVRGLCESCSNCVAHLVVSTTRLLLNWSCTDLVLLVHPLLAQAVVHCTERRVQSTTASICSSPSRSSVVVVI